MQKAVFLTINDTAKAEKVIDSHFKSVFKEPTGLKFQILAHMLVFTHKVWFCVKLWELMNQMKIGEKSEKCDMAEKMLFHVFAEANTLAHNLSKSTLDDADWDVKPGENYDHATKRIHPYYYHLHIPASGDVCQRAFEYTLLVLSRTLQASRQYDSNKEKDTKRIKMFERIMKHLAKQYLLVPTTVE